MDFIKNYWSKLPKKWKYEIGSGVKTMFTAMLIELGIQIQANANNIASFGALKLISVAIVSAVLRAGIKALWAFVVSQIKTKK